MQMQTDFQNSFTDGFPTELSNPHLFATETYT